MSIRGMSEEEVRHLVASVAEQAPAVAPARFGRLEPVETAGGGQTMEFLGDIPVTVEARLGEARLTVRGVLELQEGSVIELERMAGEPVDVYVNGRLLATGEVVVINEVFGLRINSLA